MIGKKEFRCSAILLCIIFVLLSQNVKVYAESKEQVRDVMIISGIITDKKGNLIGSRKKVTRGEFAQILIQASTLGVKMQNVGKRKLFHDVTSKYSKAEYVNTAVSKGYMSGYTNGKFNPQKGITLRDAIYGCLSLLGYTKEDLNGNLSTARYEKYKELGLGKHISKKEKQVLNQTDCIYLFYNLLNAKKKTGEIYGTTLGYEMDKKGVIDYQAMLDKKRKGAILAKAGWKKKLPIPVKQFRIYKNGKRIKEHEIEDYSVIYYIKEIKKMWVYETRKIGKVEEIADTGTGVQSLRIDGKNYVVENQKVMKNQIEKEGIEVNSQVAVLLGREKKAVFIFPVKKMLAKDGWEKSFPYELKNFQIYMNDKEDILASITSYSTIYYIKELKKLWAYNSKVYGTLEAMDINDNLPKELTIDGKAYMIENPQEIKDYLKKYQIGIGSFVILLLGKDDKIHSMLPIESVTAINNWRNSIPFSLESASIIRNGKSIVSNEIETYDVLYFSKELKMVWDYNNKKYGILNEIKPDKTAPDEIVVAGKSYSLKNNPVSVKVGENTTLGENLWGKRLLERKITEGSNVVILFGPKDMIVDIYPAEKMEVTIIGYVLGNESKMVKGTDGKFGIKNVIKIVDTSGMEREYPCEDKTILQGNIVEIDFNGINPTIKKADRGDISSLLNHKNIVASDARIIDVKNKSYKKISSAELSNIEWNPGNVIYFKKNSADEITDMILYNTTNLSHQYGIVKKVEFSFDMTTILCNIDGTDREYTISDDISWSYETGPKAFRIENDTIKEIKDLFSVYIRVMEGKQVNTGSKVYRISDTALIYYYENEQYYLGNLEDIDDISGHTVYGYLEKSDGPIEVLVIMN